jgi:hypothetical protein
MILGALSFCFFLADFVNSPRDFGTILMFQDTIFIVSFSIAFTSIEGKKNWHII